jgi:methylase of polypeptide subunit release factors
VKANNAKKILELGAGHGRDTIFFASNGIEVDALDYSSVAIDILNNESRGLSQIKELLLGIVSHSIIKHANIPVLIVK